MWKEKTSKNEEDGHWVIFRREAVDVLDKAAEELKCAERDDRDWLANGECIVGRVDFFV